MACSASRLSSVAAWGSRLPLYAAALSTPSTSSCEHGERFCAAAPTKLILANMVGNPPLAPRLILFAALALGVDGAAA
jgi:hypothetical protein